MNLNAIAEQLAGVVFGVFVGGGLVALLFRAWVESRFRVTAEKKLGEYRHRLDVMTAAASFDHQRRLQEHSLYISRKHDAMARLYRLLLDGTSTAIRTARGDKDIPLIRDMNEPDARDQMENHSSVPKGKVVEIMAKWDSSRDEAYDDFLRYLDSMRFEYARRAVIKAHNCRLRYAVYLPDQIEAETGDLIRRLQRLLDKAEAGLREGEVYAECAALEDCFTRLREQFRREMRRVEHEFG